MLHPASLAIIIMVGLLISVWLGFLWWGHRSGQLQDIEKAKYRVLEEDHGQPETEREDAPSNGRA